MNAREKKSLFERYVAMGERRSYRRLAREAKMSLGALVALAKRERWQQRLEALQRRRCEDADQRLVDALVERELKPLRARHAILAKKLELAARSRVQSVAEAVELLSLGVDLEHCLVKGHMGLAEQLVELQLLRMGGRGELDLETVRWALNHRGFAA